MGTIQKWVYLDIGEVVVEGDIEVVIATIDYGRDRAEEDGRLIAAAPELLSALQAMMSDRMDGPDSATIWYEAEAAIAKATQP